MGRPSTFTQEIADEICERLSNGEPLAAICRDDGMPHPSTFRNWCDAEVQLNGESLAIAYARAREVGFDALAAECLEIADDGTNDWRKRHGEEEDEDVLNHEHISRSKLRVETRLKLLAKWDPKRYGDKTLVGSDPENPLPTGFNVSLISPAKND